MAHSDDLSKAVDSITGDNEYTLEQRIDALGQEIIANALYLIDKNSRGQKTSPEEDDEQQEMIKRFNEIDKVYTKLKKSNRIGSGNQNFDAQLLAAIKSKKSSISGIVVGNTREGV